MYSLTPGDHKVTRLLWPLYRVMSMVSHVSRYDGHESIYSCIVESNSDSFSFVDFNCKDVGWCQVLRRGHTSRSNSLTRRCTVVSEKNSYKIKPELRNSLRKSEYSIDEVFLEMLFIRKTSVALSIRKTLINIKVTSYTVMNYCKLSQQFLEYIILYLSILFDRRHELV